MAQSNVSKLPLSIQGEQQEDAVGGWYAMDQDDVDAYVDRSSDGVLICRERGRHWWPTIREAGIVFSDVDDSTGLFIRRLECKSCKLAVRKEWWEAVRRGRSSRFYPVSASIEYHEGPEGERYLAPQGRGHMTARQVRESLASAALTGQSPAAMRRAITRHQETAQRNSSDAR